MAGAGREIAAGYCGAVGGVTGDTTSAIRVRHGYGYHTGEKGQREGYRLAQGRVWGVT